MGGFAQAVDNLAAAIKNAEGYGVAGAIPTTANNPGDLALGDIGYGTSGSANITNYPDLASGEAALKNQVTKMLGGSSSFYNPNMTLDQTGAIYSGSTDGNWAANVAKMLGVPTSTTLGSIAAGNTPVTSSIAAGNTPVTSNPSTPTTTPSSSLFDSITSFLTGKKDSSNQSGWLSRGVFVMLGLLLIAAGLFQFKQTQAVITTVGKHAAKAAEMMI